MRDEELTGLTVARAATLLRARKVSPVELTRACLDRIERLNPTLNAPPSASHSARSSGRCT